MTDKVKNAELNEAELDQVQGGILIGLLLPAVQKVREAPASSSAPVREEVSFNYEKIKFEY